MRRVLKTVLSLFILEFDVFTIGTNFTDSDMSSTSHVLYADPPVDDIEPPDDSILNSPVPQDTVIFGPYGEPIIIVIN